jgi:multiple sugar transport system permease protein
MLFLSPNIIGFLLFTAGPVLASLAMAFTNWNLQEGVPLRFIGLQNFVELLQEREFWAYFANTIYLMLALPATMAGSLGLALLLHEMKLEQSLPARIAHAGIALGCAVLIAGAFLTIGSDGGRWVAGCILFIGAVYALAVVLGIVVFRTLYYLPFFTSGVALFILWKALYNPEFGPINAVIRFLLEGFGGSGGLNGVLAVFGVGPLSPPEWLSSIKNLLGLSPEGLSFHKSLFGLGARDALNLMGFVTTVGGTSMLLYLAGLSNIPPELYEAADIDGADWWQKFRHVTWPQLAPTTFFIVVTNIIGGMQGGFEVARVMTQGGPAGTTTTLSYYIYQKAFMDMEFGYASAIAWFLFIIIFGLTIINWKFGNRYVND